MLSKIHLCFQSMWGVGGVRRSGGGGGGVLVLPLSAITIMLGNKPACGARSSTSRRAALLAGPALFVATVVRPSTAVPLAPLGPVTRIGGDKRVGLSTDEIKEILAKDISEGQYFVTGKLTREVFADDCRFVDPTNDVTGLSKYVTALGILFDPQYSKVVLRDIKVTGPLTIEADYASGGYLNDKYFPWRPRVEPYEGHIVYTLNEEGLVAVQAQTWNISPAEALKETFTPTFGPRLPVGL